MKQLFLKEIREQTGIILMGVFIALMIVFVFWIKDPGTSETFDPAGHASALENLFLVLFVVYAAAISNAIASDRDRGDQSFLASLPLHPASIWLIKLAAAAVALIIIHLSISVLGILFGYPQLVMFIMPTQIPRLLLFLLLLSICSTLLGSALFRRAFSVLVAGCLLTFSLAFLSAYIQMFWQWRSMMEWPLAAGCAGMILTSAAAYTTELRTGHLPRKQTWFAAASILLMMSLILPVQYIKATYQTPDLSRADVIEWVPGIRQLLISSDVDGPLFMMSTGNRKFRRLGRRFESLDPREISSDGKYVILYDHRGMMGSYDYSDYLSLIDDDWFQNPTRPLSKWIWQDPQDEMISGFGSSILVLNLESGRRTRIGDCDYGRPLRATWYDHSDTLAVIFLKRTGNNIPVSTSIALMKPDGSFIRYLVEPREQGYITIADDRSTLACLILHEAETDGRPRIETSFKTVNDSIWQQSDHLRAIPSVSPDHQWILSYSPQTENDRSFILITASDGTVIQGGNTRNDELAEWSPNSRRLLFTRENIPDTTGTTGRRELALFSTDTRSISAFPAEASRILDSEFASWSAKVMFSPDEQHVAVCGHSPTSTVIVYPAPCPSEFIALPDSKPMGWLDTSSLLLRKKLSGAPDTMNLIVLDIVTGKETPFLQQSQSNP
ncbi:hypothetical protein JW823_09095 [bacterium]|nr:hypothetical protein [candidate division CSSED10-310 bacterium]